MFLENRNYTCSVILPLYKPRGNWVELYLQNARQIKSLLPSYISMQFVVVYDGMPDEWIRTGFRKISKAIKNVRFISYSKNMGKGYALRQGVQAVNTDFILTTDFDFPYKKNQLLKLIEVLINGSDIVVGKRNNSYF